MKRADQVTGIILLIFSIILMEESWRMPQSATFGPGVGFLPFWLGALMGALSILLMIKARRRPTNPNEPPVFPRKKALFTLLTALGGLAAYILLLEVIGFLLDTALFTAFLLWVVEREKWTMTISVAILNAIGLYVIFRIFLGVSLPRNIFGF